jgi:hypothetical protein
MEQRFKVGDSVTFLSCKESAELKLRDDSLELYFYGGIDQAGHVGRVVKYLVWNTKNNCWKIEVTARHGTNYSMLECEFKEYQNSKIYEIY